MINIPMNTKPPVKLAELAAPQNMKIRQPLTLKEIPQTAPAGQAVGRTQTVSGQPPANRAQTAPAVGRTQTVSGRSPANRAQIPPAEQAVDRPQTASARILPGVRPGVEMKKGQKVSLTQKNPRLEEIEVRLGWKVKNTLCDVDASAFLLGADNKVPGEEWFIFYGQTESPDGSVLHRSADKNGAGLGDAEVIGVKLNRVRPNIKRIVFILTINEALKKGLNFGMVSDAYIRVVDKSSDSEIVRFVLDEYYENVTSMVVGEIYERNSEWRFNAVGNGVARDLAGLCELYGVQASY